MHPLRIREQARGEVQQEADQGAGVALSIVVARHFALWRHVRCCKAKCDLIPVLKCGGEAP